MLFEFIIPTVLEKSREIRLMSSHPRYLILKNNRLVQIINPFAQQLKRLHPRIRHHARPSRLGTKAFPKILQLISIRLPFTGSQTLYDNQFNLVPAREFLKQG